MYEKFCFELINFSFQTALTDQKVNIPLSGQGNDDLLDQISKYIYHIKQYMNTLNNKNKLQILVNNFLQLKQSKLSYDLVDSDEEGFFEELQEDTMDIKQEEEEEVSEIAN